MDHLIGTDLPAVNLNATSELIIDPSKLKGKVVIFCYSYTGRPGHANPPGWDDIVGAHGSTPQALAYSRLYSEFRKLGASVFGLSLQDPEWQRDFAARNGLAFPLLSDAARGFSGALGLPVFRAGEEDFLRRLTVIAEDGRIVQVRYPVAAPEEDAGEVLAWLQARPPPAASRRPPP